MAASNNNESGPVIPVERSFDPCYRFVGGVQVQNAQSVTESVEVYTRMGVVSVYTGKHMREGDIRKPISAVAIPDKDLVAIIHNGRLVSLVNCTTCQIEETFVVRDPVGFAMTRGLRGELVADNADYLYVTSEGAVSIFRFNYKTVRDPSNVQPEIFASVPENTTRFFRGMAISLSRRLFFTAYGKEIFAFALADGMLMSRWELPEDLSSALVQSAIDMQMGPGILPKVFLVSTTQGGTRIFGKLLNFDGEPDNAPYQMIGRDTVGGLGQIRHCAFDKFGNLICADSKRRLIHVFPPSVTGAVVSFAPPEEDEQTGEWITDLKNDTIDRIFNPSSVAVLVDPLSRRKQPLVVVTDFTLDALVFFAPEIFD